MFRLGRLVMTKTVNDRIAENAEFAKEVVVAFDKYKCCDWGDMCREDKNLNDFAISADPEQQGRVLAAYNTSEGKIYIITEWDRSYTTILFANEY